MPDVRHTAAKLLLFVVETERDNGLARDAPMASKADDGLRAGGSQGLQAAPGGGARPRANHRPRVDDGRDPAEVRCMQPLEGVDLESHATARRLPRGVGYHAEEVVSKVAHVTTGLVAQREESVALRHGVIKPGSVLPRGTPNGPVPRKEGGGGAVPWVSTDDSPNVRDGAA